MLELLCIALAWITAVESFSNEATVKANIMLAKMNVDEKVDSTYFT